MTKSVIVLVVVLFTLTAVSVAADPPGAANDLCGRPVDNQPVTGTAVTIDELMAKPPRSGRFVTVGFAQVTSHCMPCPANALCKPCEEVVWFSPMFGAFKDALTREQNLVLNVPDARRFERLKQYRVAFVACDVSSNLRAPLTAELRGFAPMVPKR